MRIQHNIQALNSYNKLQTNNGNVSKNLEKLSSGFRINRAGDDAAGLAISEKMRAQITGLETATKNANDGISLVQTAEGALTEVHSMLNRMSELATQSANGTYQNDVDRENLQKEVTSLKSEIDRISDSTNYNGIKLLDGSLGGTSKAGGLTGASIVSYKGAETAATTGTDATATGEKASYTVTLSGDTAVGDELVIGGLTITAAATAVAISDPAAAAATQSITVADAEDATKVAAAINAHTANKFAASVADGKLVLTAKEVGAGTLPVLTIAGTDKGTVTEDIAGKAGTDFTKQDTIKVDGTEIKVDWSKLSVADKAAVQKNWTSSTSPSDAKSAAQIMQDTINESIKNYNTQYGASVSEIKIEGSIAGTATEFKVSSTLKDASSAVSFTGAADSLLGNVFGTSEVKTAVPVATADFQVGDVNGKFIMSVDGEDLEVDLSGVTGPDDVATKLQAAIDTALTNYDTAKGNTTADANLVKGTITVKLDNDGALEFSNTSGKKLSFSDKEGKEFAKTLGISTEGKALANGGLALQVGDTSEDFQKVTVKVDSMSTNSLGIETVNIGTQAGADKAIDSIKNAINTVSSTRGDLGAIQNRLEHTINNLSVTSENMTAAESRIRDTDMAKEMMNFTKNNILSQAAQSMLAQANQLPQGVLQLLQ